MRKMLSTVQEIRSTTMVSRVSGEVGPMNEKQPVESLRAKFWRMLPQQQSLPQFYALVDEIVRTLPVERVQASRLQLMPGLRIGDGLIEQTLKDYSEDVRNGCTDDWKPLIVSGLRESGWLSVRDGTHRTKAIQNNGAQDLSVKVVFVKVGPRTLRSTATVRSSEADGGVAKGP